MSKLTKNNFSAENTKLYLNVPFELKDQAKTLGARWDVDYGMWFVYNSCTRITEISKLATTAKPNSLVQSKVRIPKFIVKHEFSDTDYDDLIINDKIKLALKYKPDEIQTLISEIVKPEIINRKPDLTKIYGFNKK